MTRPSKRALRPEHRAALALGIRRSWQPGDNVASVAARLGKPEHRIKEALAPLSAQVISRKGMTADQIVEETGLPRAYVVHVMRWAYAMRDAKRDREGDHDAPEVLKAAKRYRGQGLSRAEALREARRAYGSQPRGHA